MLIIFRNHNERIKDIKFSAYTVNFYIIYCNTCYISKVLKNRIVVYSKLTLILQRLFSSGLRFITTYFLKRFYQSLN